MQKLTQASPSDPHRRSAATIVITSDPIAIVQRTDGYLCSCVHYDRWGPPQFYCLAFLLQYI